MRDGLGGSTAMSSSAKTAFERYIGIDYSGAATPRSGLKGLRIYQANPATWPDEVSPPPGPRKYWTRMGIAQWLAENLAESSATLVGIDHGFSFPLRYFEVHHLALDWSAFLTDFHHHWPTDGNTTHVDFVRLGFSFSVDDSVNGSISGHSTAGRSRRDTRPSPRSIRPFGRMTTRRRNAPRTSTMPIAPPPGCVRSIWTAACRRSSHRT